MIVILHGDNIVASRNRLRELRTGAAGKEIITFSLLPDVTTLTQALESQSLFGTERTVILEGFLSALGRKTKDNALAYLTKGEFSTDCILWEGKAIAAGVISGFSKTTSVEHFKLTSSMFRFLESIGVLSGKDLINLYHTCLKEGEVEFIFAMILRQMRLLLGVKIGANLLETSRMQSWQLGKIRRQTERFTLEKLLWIHSNLYRIDTQMKRGQNVLPLSGELDILLSEI